MPSKCEILFDNNVERIVYSGQLVVGRVILTLAEEESMKSILLVFFGKGMCNWSKQTRRRRKRYNGDESYLCSQIYLLGSANSEETILPPGVYTYTFETTLPRGLPSSLTGENGAIEYNISVTVYRPESSDQSFGQKFTVVKPFDLNSDPALREVVNKKKKCRFSPVCCWCCCICCCESEPLFLEARIPATGYRPREIISLQLISTNTSSEDISEFKIELVRQITWREHANGRKTKNERSILWEARTDGCAKDEKQDYRIEIPVPNTPPSDDATSKIFSVTYTLRIEGAVGCWHIIPSLEFPIVIGADPSYPEYSENILAANPVAVPSGPSVISAASTKSNPNQAIVAPTAPITVTTTVYPALTNQGPSNVQTDCDPPSYEEAIQSG